MADTKLELAYFAGFFDGEGSVGIYRKKYVVSLTNTDVRSLQRARELWGGHIATQGRETREFAIQDLFRWQIYGHGSRAFLEAIRPFVITKAEQIDVYLDALDHVPVGRGQKREPGATEVIDLAAVRLKQLKAGVA